MESPIKILVDKYLDGISTLEEEKQLTDYFNSGEIEPEHLPYRKMFEYFASEKEDSDLAREFIDFPVIPIKRNKERNIRKIWIIAGTLAAACIAILVLITPLFHKTTRSDTYLVIRNQYIDDEEMAVEYANTYIAKTSSILKNNLSILNKIPVISGKNKNEDLPE